MIGNTKLSGKSEIAINRSSVKGALKILHELK